MRLKIFIFLLFLVFSCSSIENKFVDKTDFNNITKEEIVNNFSNEIKDLKNKEDILKSYDNLIKINFNNVNLFEGFNLLDLILEKYDKKKVESTLKIMYKNYEYNLNLMNKIALLEYLVGNYKSSFEIAWTSKTIKPNYLADEIFLKLISEDAEVIIEDMKSRYPNYPLNKYNEVIYKYFSNKKINAEDIQSARNDIRKISNKFYKELLIYRSDLLYKLLLLEVTYYTSKNEKEKLKKIYEEILELKEKNNKLDIIIKGV